MKGKKLIILLSLALVAGLFGVLPAPRALAASGTLDFGITPSGTLASTSNTGFGGVRIGSGGGSFIILNQGQEIGTRAELRGTASSTGSINSVGVTSAEYGTVATVFTVAFEVYFSGGSSGTWYFFAGNGTSYGSAQSVGFTGAETFTGLRFVYGASDTITANNRNGANWNATGISGTPFAQSTPYTVSVIGNNSASTVDYGSGTVAAYKYDLWVNGILIGNDLAKAELANGTTINAFRFYGENSTGNVAMINLDNIRWWNQAVPPSMSSYSTVSSMPALTYSVLNMNSGNASLAGNVTVNELLSLNTGNLTLGASNLTLGTSATVGGTPSTTSMVVTDTDGSASGDGFLCKRYSGNVSFTFPVGDTFGTPEFSPSTLNFTSGSYNGGDNSACVQATDSVYSPIPANRASWLTRYWTVTSTNITGFSCNVSFNYVQSDVNVVPPATESSISYQHSSNSGATWTQGAPTDATNNLLSGTVTSFSVHTGFSQLPTAVTLADFGAVQQGDAVQLTWETNSELNNRGFNLYRGTSAAGWDRRLNETLIPSQSQGNPGGFIYTWEDRAELASGTTYFYWVEDVDINGAATMHGPVSVDYLVPTAVTLSSIQASPAAAGPVALLAETLLALLASLAGALAVRRRRRA